MILLAEGPAPSVQANTIGLKLLFSTSRIRFSYFIFLIFSWYLYASLISLRQLFASGLKIFTSKNVRSNLCPESICFDVRSSFLVRAGGFVVEGLLLQLLKHGLDLDVVANFINQIGEGIPNLVVAHNFISAFGAMQGMSKISIGN